MDKHELRDLYIQETGNLFFEDVVKYADWMEERLTAHNSATVQFTADQLYGAAKEAGLHNADIDGLISVIGKQHQ